jgi:hypothetical protein
VTCLAILSVHCACRIIRYNLFTPLLCTTIGNPVLDGVGQPIMIEVDEDGNEVPGAGKTEEEKKVRAVLSCTAISAWIC